MQATLSSKFQITIPAKLRKKFRLQPGMKLDFDETASDLRAQPCYDFDVARMRRLVGSAKNLLPGKSGREVLAEIRGYDRDER
jgi:AbrB family looped-hinge helix DNA binding protein